MSKAFGIALILAAVAIAFVLFGNQAVNKGLLESLRADTPKCRKILDFAEKSGLVLSNDRNTKGTTTLKVEDSRWASLPHDEKVSLALASYCLDAPDSGEHLVSIRGYRDGASKGYVSNGHWSD